MARTQIHRCCCRNPVALGNAGSARCSLRQRAGPGHSNRAATLRSLGGPAQPGKGSDLATPYELTRGSPTVPRTKKTLASIHYLTKVRE
jgi:hypothetical protein